MIIKPVSKLQKHGFFTNSLKTIIRMFTKKPKIFNLNDSFIDSSLFICNHAGAGGPFSLSLFFPKLLIPWGAYQMTEGYFSRWKYLYHVFYQQKLNYGKTISFFLATVFASFSKILYNGMHVIPTYPDIRIRKTLDYSKRHLNIGNSILIFPEDSAEGYHDVVKRYHSGFIYLAMDYFHEYQIDLPVYPVYYHQKANAILIDKPIFIQDYIKKGFRRDQIAETIKNKINAMRNQLSDLLRN